MRDHGQLERRIQDLLADPEHAGHPLAAVLAELYAEFGDMVHQLDRVTHISDRYQSVSQDASRSLSERYQKQLRQLEKLARISDRYQSMMRDLNEALKEASQRDPLTGIGNRRMLMERIKAEAARAERLGRPLTVAMADVDRFKLINDAYGHDAGDQALIGIARTIRNGMRDYDLCGRWGGEEFMMILPEIEVEDGKAVVERIRQAIQHLDVSAGDVPLALTASFGIAQRRDGESTSDTISRADAALLHAKRNGRNRCEIAL